MGACLQYLLLSNRNYRNLAWNLANKRFGISMSRIQFIGFPSLLQFSFIRLFIYFANRGNYFATKSTADKFSWLLPHTYKGTWLTPTGLIYAVSYSFCVRGQSTLLVSVGWYRGWRQYVVHLSNCKKGISNLASDVLGDIFSSCFH